MEHIICQTSNGKVFICNKCEKIHIEFFHFLFTFDEEAFDYFKDNIAQLDGDYYENVNTRLHYRRKIVVPLGHRNVSMLLNQKELNELQLLLSSRCYISKMDCFLSVKEIGMPIAVN